MVKILTNISIFLEETKHFLNLPNLFVKNVINRILKPKNHFKELPTDALLGVKLPIKEKS